MKRSNWDANLPQVDSGHREMQQQQASCFGDLDLWKTAAASRLTTKEEMDQFIAQSVAELSFQDRQRELEELHGVAQVSSEHAPFIEAKLQELNTEVTRLKHANSSYKMAEKMSPLYVGRRDFRLMFLRADRYDPIAAAERVFRFFHVKGKLFGDDKLVQDISFNDLDEKDKEVLLSGTIQALDRRDSIGRQLVVSLSFGGLHRGSKVIQNDLRGWYYTIMKALERQRTQIQGFTFIFYAVGQYRDSAGGYGLLDAAKLIVSLPFHVASFHFCCDDHTQLLLFSSAVKLLFAHKIIARFKVHFGSHLECQAALNGYGIPSTSLSLSSTDFQPVLVDQLEWYKECERMDTVDRKRTAGVISPPRPTTSEHVDRSISPKAEDVLLGSGYNHHDGNLRLHQVMDSVDRKYSEASSPDARLAICDFVLCKMREFGSRFLRVNNESMQWEDVGNAEARQRVAKAFRNRRRVRERKKNKG
eukprot:scaffold657_cov108-Cylindrotheca_fusiformis.AAC.5